jgi:hypothetical protein
MLKLPLAARCRRLSSSLRSSAGFANQSLVNSDAGIVYLFVILPGNFTKCRNSVGLAKNLLVGIPAMVTILLLSLGNNMTEH